MLFNKYNFQQRNKINKIQLIVIQSNYIKYYVISSLSKKISRNKQNIILEILYQINCNSSVIQYPT